MPERHVPEEVRRAARSAARALLSDDEFGRASADRALQAAMDPALGDQRLVPLAAVLDVLRGYSILLHPDECAARLARTFGGEPDER